MITRMRNDEMLEIRSMISTDGPLEQWERSIQTAFPLKRTTSSMIGTYIPRFRGSCSSVADAGSLADALSKKSKYYETQLKRRLFEEDDMRVEVALKRFGFKPTANQHYGAFLSPHRSQSL